MAIKEEVKNEDGVETKTREDSSTIVGIVPNSAAAEAGLQKGDVITAIDGKAISNQQDVLDALGKYKKGDKITVAYTRDGQSKKTKATLKGHTGNETLSDNENTNVEVSVEEDEEGNVTTTTITTVTKNGEEKVKKEVKKTKTN